MQGSSGDDVKELQTILIGWGYDLGSYGADGDYGTKTKTAVANFQRAHGLADDGEFGPLTYTKLLERLSLEIELPAGSEEVIEEEPTATENPPDGAISDADDDPEPTGDEDPAKDTDRVVSVTGNSVNVRTQPNTAGKIVYVAKKGEHLAYAGMTSMDGWHCVVVEGVSAWISGKYSTIEQVADDDPTHDPSEPIVDDDRAIVDISAYQTIKDEAAAATMAKNVKLVIHRAVNAEGKTMAVGSFLVPVLTERVNEQDNIVVLYETRATELLTSGDAVTGVKVESAGTTYDIAADAVIIATGGFGANADLYTKYQPGLTGFVTTNAPGATGDGIVMAEAIGAATVDMEQIQIHPTVEQSTSALITEGLRGDGAILVNQEGKRFIDEVGTRDVVSAAIIAEPGSYAYLIVDQKMVDASSVIAGYITKGLTKQGDTLDALAAEIGADAAALTETMDTWNAAVAAGNDAAFGRTSFASALDTAPYYAIQIAPGVHHTMGGLKINTDTQAIGTDGNPIVGLFAAGEVTGGVHGANRLGGNAVADIVVFGRIAGQNAAQNAAAANLAA